MTEGDDEIKALTEIVLSMQQQMHDELAQIKFSMATKQDLEALSEKFAAKEDIHKLQDTLDGIANRLDIDGTERVAMSAEINRQEEWIEESAPVIGVPYSTTA